MVICLISKHFLTSEFIKREEIPDLLTAERDRGLLLFPILIGPCIWNRISWLKQIQMFTANSNYLSKYKADDDEVDDFLNKAVNEIAEFLEAEESERKELSAPVLTSRFPQLPDDAVDIKHPDFELLPHPDWLPPFVNKRDDLDIPDLPDIPESVQLL